MRIRDQPAESRLDAIASQSALVSGQNRSVDEHRSTGNGLEDDNNSLQRQELGQVIDVNLSAWKDFYPTGISPLHVLIIISLEKKVHILFLYSSRN